jgi:excisionase family DNA binding protein
MIHADPVARGCCCASPGAAWSSRLCRPMTCAAVRARPFKPENHPFSFFSNYDGLTSALIGDTVLPPNAAEVLQLQHLADLLDSETQLSLVTADGQTFELTGQLRNILAHASRVLGSGHALEPRDAVLSTQEAADALGVSRPTLVKLLESGEIPFTKPGRHRRVQLKDVLDYQQRIRQHRREILAAMTEEAAEDDAYRHITGLTETR